MLDQLRKEVVAHGEVVAWVADGALAAVVER